MTIGDCATPEHRRASVEVIMQVLITDKLFMFVWAVVAGIVAFAAQQAAEILKARANSRRQVIATTQTAVLERLITAVALACSVKSKELRSLERYARQLKESRQPDSRVTREQLDALDAKCAELVLRPLPSDSFVPPEFADLVQKIEEEAALAWVRLDKENEADLLSQIDQILVDLHRCHQALAAGARSVRQELWHRLRKAWSEAGMAPILEPIPLEHARELLLKSETSGGSDLG